MICDNIAVNEKGHLTFAGYDTVELAEKYGTPLYLMDENKIRAHVRTYKNAMAKYMPEGSLPEFASKAFSCKQIYRIMAEEGMAITNLMQTFCLLWKKALDILLLTAWKNWKPSTASQVKWV